MNDDRVMSDDCVMNDGGTQRDPPAAFPDRLP